MCKKMTAASSSPPASTTTLSMSHLRTIEVRTRWKVRWPPRAYEGNVTSGLAVSVVSVDLLSVRGWFYSLCRYPQPRMDRDAPNACAVVSGVSGERTAPWAWVRYERWSTVPGELPIRTSRALHRPDELDNPVAHTKSPRPALHPTIAWKVIVACLPFESSPSTHSTTSNGRREVRAATMPEVD